VKKTVEEGVADVRQVMSTEDVEGIRKATEKLGETIQKIGAAMYQAPEQGGPQGPGGPAADGPQPGGPSGQQPGGEDVVDGEFKQV